jgi:hypothetical protein
MKACLMHPDRDFDLHQAAPGHAKTLSQDLELGVLWRAMVGGAEGADEDKVLLDVAISAILAGLTSDVDTILYRREVLKDCVQNPAQARELYALAVAAIEGKKRYWISAFRSYPTGTLHSAVDALDYFTGQLRRLRAFADRHVDRFRSRGLVNLIATLRAELDDAYFARIERHLRDLRFRGGELLSAELTAGNGSANYILHQPPSSRLNWFQRLVRRLLRQDPPGVTFVLPGPDEAGARILGEMRDRGINLVANALAQSSDHIHSFFEMLRIELAFFIGCLNLHGALTAKGSPIAFPEPLPLSSGGECAHRFTDLRDASLVLTKGEGVVGNSVNADGKSLVIITGANQGGKSSFLRAVGLAQVMMQSGMFVAAGSFAAEVVSGVFTHYKREEDATMKSGKFDEELARMSGIVAVIAPNALVLFNESFASTNAREGSEIAGQIVRALLDRKIKVFFVTHLYEFAHGLFEQMRPDALFLRAERLANGTRTFRLVEREPLETSYGQDLYREVFESRADEHRAG